MANLSITTVFLIVDDEVSSRKRVKETLRAKGFKGPFFESDDIGECKDILHRQKFLEKKPVEYILCDWEMPLGTGLEFVKWLREESEFSDLPFLMLTSVNDREKILSAIHSGVSNYILKPFSSTTLVDKLIKVAKEE